MCIRDSPKGQRFDLVVEKATEIGVHTLIPMVTARSVVRPSARDDRWTRWQRIAISAMKQCGRTFLPRITPVMGFGEVLAQVGHHDLGLIAWEGAEGEPLERWMPRAGKVLLLIGPEGGFTPQEVEEAQRRGIKAISLGPRRLRAETAGIVALSLVLHHLGDL